MDFESLIPAYLLYAVVFGILSAIIASAKKHSAGRGFLLGFSLGIFGLLVVIFNNQSTDKERVARGEMKTCPCGNLVLNSVTTCPACGNNLANVQPNLEDFKKVESQISAKKNASFWITFFVVMGLIAGSFLLFFAFLEVRRYNARIESDRYWGSITATSQSATEVAEARQATAMVVKATGEAISQSLTEYISLTSEVTPNCDFYGRNMLWVTMTNTGNQDLDIYVDYSEDFRPDFMCSTRDEQNGTLVTFKLSPGESAGVALNVNDSSGREFSDEVGNYDSIIQLEINKFRATKRIQFYWPGSWTPD